MKGYEHLKALEEFVERVRGLDPEAVILFGSLAKGDFHTFSDADVCVVLSKERVDFIEGQDLVKDCNIGGTVQVVVYGKEQFLGMIEEANPFALEIVHDGLFLEGREEFLRRIEESLLTLSEKFEVERRPDGWRIKLKG